MRKKISRRRSGFEPEVEAALLKKFPGLTYESETLSYVIPAREAKHIPDFVAKGKKKVYFEAKGYFSSQDRTKLLRVKAAHPKVDLRIIFQADNWLTKKKKSRYSDWARKHGFRFCIWPNLEDVL